MPKTLDEAVGFVTARTCKSLEVRKKKLGGNFTHRQEPQQVPVAVNAAFAHLEMASSTFMLPRK
jgi:hypothetical protein